MSSIILSPVTSFVMPSSTMSSAMLSVTPSSVMSSVMLSNVVCHTVIRHACHAAIRHVIHHGIRHTVARLVIRPVRHVRRASPQEKQRQLGDRMDLNSYLLKPVQRMGKYALLLRQMMKAYPTTTHPEYHDIMVSYPTPTPSSPPPPSSSPPTPTTLPSTPSYCAR